MMQYKWIFITGVYVLFIFSQSMLPATLSSVESGYALDLLSNLLSNMGLEEHGLTEFLIRKSGHFLEYFGFGLLLVICVRQFQMKRRRRISILATFLIWVPFIDETIQLFSEGRSSQITDVWIDMCGGFAGILLMSLIITILEKKNQKKYVPDEEEHNEVC